jgi:hypothetical protein
MPACEYAQRPVLTPKQGLEFGKWYSDESPGLSADPIMYLEKIKPTED